MCDYAVLEDGEGKKEYEYSSQLMTLHNIMDSVEVGKGAAERKSIVER